MRLATFNIKHGAPAEKYWGDPKAAAEACAELNADILAVQEVDVGVRRSKRADMAALIARACDMKFVFAHTMEFGTGYYGNALFVRGDITDEEVLPLGGNKRGLGPGKLIKFGYEPRNAILATAHVDGAELSVAATHLSTNRTVRWKQIGMVAASLEERPGPRVLLGDLNMKLSAARRHAHARSLEFTEGEATFPLPEPRRQIDHIAVSGLTVVAREVRPMPISDHCAFIADVEVS